MFTPRALESLYTASRGVPRLINILCHKSLMAAFGKGQRTIEEEHMKAAIEDTDTGQRSKTWSERLFGDRFTNNK